MNKKITPIVLVVSIVLLAIGLHRVFVNKKDSSTTQNSIKNGVFYNDATGWSIKIPDDWELLPDVSSDMVDIAASKYNEVGVDTDVYLTKWLIGFKKDELNFFRAFYENNPYVGEEHLEESVITQRETIKDMLPAGWVITHLSAITPEYIDGKRFLKFSFNSTNPRYGNSVSAITYVGIVGNKYFGVSIYSTTTDNENTLLKVWSESKFEDKKKR